MIGRHHSSRRDDVITAVYRDENEVLILDIECLVLNDEPSIEYITYENVMLGESRMQSCPADYSTQPVIFDTYMTRPQIG
jgi:hypothetical protein